MEEKEKERNEEASLPNAKVGQVAELVKQLSVLGEVSDREGLAYALGIDKKSIGHPIRAAKLIGLVSVDDSRVVLTEAGRKFVEGDEESKKQVFKERLNSVEPFATIFRALQNRNELSSAEVLNLVKAKVPAARSWKPSTDKEMLKMIRNWFDFVGIKFVESITSEGAPKKSET